MPTSSPFAPYANADLSFEVSDGAYWEDGETGNPTVGKRTIAIKAILNPSNAAPKFLPGSSEYWEQMSGYMVDPLTLPPELSTGMVGTATIRVAPNAVQTGTFRLYPVTNSPYVLGARVDIITEIKGLFKRQQ